MGRYRANDKIFEQVEQASELEQRMQDLRIHSIQEDIMYDCLQIELPEYCTFMEDSK